MKVFTVLQYYDLLEHYIYFSVKAHATFSHAQFVTTKAAPGQTSSPLQTLTRVLVHLCLETSPPTDYNVNSGGAYFNLL